MTTPDPGALYADTRDRFAELVRSLDPDQGASPVPLCPGWAVSDVAAHVCGINADMVSGQLEGLGTDAWTARQVGERAGHSLSQICDEWMGLAGPIAEKIAANPFLGIRLTGDLVVHLQDVQDALGSPINTDDEATIAAAHRYVPPLQERANDRLGVALEVELTDGSRFPAAGDTPDVVLTLRATPYDFLRSVTGRRSRRQIEGLDWQGDPTGVLDAAWSAYGTFPLDDVGV